jgi:hypothetical protein
MYTIEEITDIIKTGFADLSNVDPDDVDVYNVQETTPPGTYTYDATVYFRASETNAETRASTFKESITVDATQFNQNLIAKIVERKPELASKASMSVDTESPKLTRSLNKGKSKPRFDRIIPVVEGFSTDVGIPDYLEIKDVTCVRSLIQVSTSFTVHTNLLNEKILWRVKSATDPNLESKQNFETWIRDTSDATQAQSYFTLSENTLSLSNKLNTSVYQSNMATTSNLSDVTGPVYVYIQVYFEKYPDFSTLLVETI